MTSDITYIILNLALLGIFLFAGWRISKGGNYLKNSILCIIAYTLISGSRYARGVDYLHYVDVYKNDLIKDEWLFSELNELLKTIGVGPHYIFYFYSFIIILCICSFFSIYKKSAKWLFPLFIIATLSIAENHIRQFVGFSIICLFLKQLAIIKQYSPKYKYISIIFCLVCIIAAYSIHSANIIIVVLLLLLYFTIKSPIPYYISIPLYIFASYLFNSIIYLNYVESVADFLGQYNILFNSYAEGSGKWFSSEGYSDIYTRTPFVKFLETVGNVTLFYMSWEVIDKKNPDKQDIITYTNVFIIGSIFQKAFMNFEIMNRMGAFCVLFYIFPLAYVMYNFQLIRKNRLFVICSVFLLFWVWDYFRYVFMNPSMTKFLWDTIYF